MNRTTTVLLLGTNERAGLTLSRSLGRRGIRVEVARLSPSPAERSRHVSAVHHLGDPLLDVDSYVSRLEELLRATPFSLLIPIDEVACEICVKFRSTIEKNVKIALPPDDAYRFARDKAALLDLCETIGVPTPRHILMRSMEDVELAAQDIAFPAFAKPIHTAVIACNRAHLFRVKYVERIEDLEWFCRLHIATVPVMLQELISGDGAGLYVFCQDGRVVSAVQQLRLHEPRWGGGSSYRMTVPISSNLWEFAQPLLERINWTGVAMLEFKGNPQTDEWHIMEMNGRLWGSLPLTVSCGLDFPHWLYLHYCDPTAPVPLRAPIVGLRQRNLKKDVAWVVLRILDTGNPWDLLRWLSDFRFALTGKERWDLESLTDPLPAVLDWLSLIGGLWKKTTRGLAGIKAAISYKLAGIKAAISYLACRRRRLARLKPKLARKDLNLLFVCKGNICRSPFASVYTSMNFQNVQSRSAGTLPVAHRLPPAPAERVAKTRFGIDLTFHPSTPLDRKMLDWADVILAMDYRNLHDLEAAGAPKDKVILLGEFGGVGPIADPYNRDDSEFERVFADIIKSIEGMLRNGC